MITFTRGGIFTSAKSIAAASFLTPSSASYKLCAAFLSPSIKDLATYRDTLDGHQGLPLSCTQSRILLFSALQNTIAELKRGKRPRCFTLRRYIRSIPWLSVEDSASLVSVKWRLAREISLSFITCLFFKLIEFRSIPDFL